MFRVRKGIKRIPIPDKEVVCLQVYINIICKAYKGPDHLLLMNINEKIKKVQAFF